MQSECFTQIVAALREAEVEFGLLEHEPVHTSEEAAEVRGMSQRIGAKSLLLKADDGFIVAIIQGDKRLDIKKLMQHLGTSKKPRFARPEEVEEQLGCQVGACYPMSYLAGVPAVLDTAFTAEESLSFNPGVHNKTIILDMDDFLTVADPSLAELT